MDLNVKEWKEFNITKLFDIGAGNYYSSDYYDEGTTPYISASATNNGVGQMINLSPDFSGNKIVTGKVECKAFYQGEPFCATSDANVFSPKFTMSKYVGLFLTSIISFNENGKWSYGRQCRVGDSKGIIIKLPVQKRDDGTPILDEKKTFSDDGYIPDWQFMERYIKSLHYKRLKTKNAKTEISDIKTDDWQEFRFGNLISKIYKAKALNKEDLLISDERSNSIRYITRTSEDNGCEFRAVLNEINPSFIEEENAISIGDTTATCFYQSEKFITGDHMVVVRADWLNKTNALFIVAILNKEQYKYSYGRAFLMDRIKDTIIRLPVKKNADGKAIIDNTHKYSENGYIPDWEFMENYIKAMPYGDRL